jgi:pSer/pThr/pTyr-binding forkhead associated (FHA) protein
MGRLALIEVLDHDGHVMRVVPVHAWPVTIGRALDCDVVLHDPHVAPLHATIGRADESAPVVLTVGDSLNGVRLASGEGDRRLGAGAQAPLGGGAMLRAGRTALRVRMPGEILAPEAQLDHLAGRSRLLLTVGAFVVLIGWLQATLWLQNDPDSGWDKYLPALIGTSFAVIGWAALWGLGSKLFQRQFRIAPHLQVVLSFLLGSLAADLLLSVGSFSLSMPILSHLRAWLEIGLFCGLLGMHVSVLLPGRERRLAITCGVLCVLSIGASGALNWRHHQRFFEELYAATLPPPALRFASAGTPAELIESLRPLQARLQRQAREDEARDAFELP